MPTEPRASALSCLTDRASPCSLVNIAETYELQPADRSLLVMPLFHVHGLMAGVMTIP